MDHLYILTPCFGSVCFTTYTISLLNTTLLLQSKKIPFKVLFCNNDSLVPRARNNLIAKAMSDPTMTHVLFIDADITWNPEDVLNLLERREDVVGGVYPIKRYHFHRKNLLDYNVNLLGEKAVNNLVPVKHLATGFLMIRRGVLDAMCTQFADKKYTDDVGFLTEAENKFAYALFDCAVVDGHYYSEDWLFCTRWREMGGRVMADISIDLSHTGVEVYEGSFRKTF